MERKKRESSLYLSFKKDLISEGLKDELLESPLDRLIHSVNASPYKKIPKMIFKAKCEKGISLVMKLALKHKIPYTFKGAGTSLSGQCISDSLLIILENEYWKKIKIEKKSHLITVQVGLTGQEVNRFLRPFGRRIGPDPSSLSVAKIGGIVANNAKGNCCGHFDDSYSTIKSMKVILYDGTILNSSDLESRAKFKKTHKTLLKRLKLISEEAKNNREVYNLIKHKYKIRNTVGLTLCALIDYEDPIDILIHLMVGSEGTLGFISEATFKTVPMLPFKSAALIFFENKEVAGEGVLILKKLGATSVEWMNDELIFRQKKLKVFAI